MDNPFFYIWINNKEFIEIYNDKYNFGFDTSYNISNLEFYFNPKQYKGDLHKIKKGSLISLESDQFYVEKAIISNFENINNDLSKNFQDENSLFNINIDFISLFMTSDDFFKIKKSLNRKRSLNKILGDGR